MCAPSVVGHASQGASISAVTCPLRTFRLLPMPPAALGPWCEPRPGTPLGQPTSYLLTASHHTAAEVATGLGVDHGGDVIFALEVCEVQLSPLSLLPVEPRCPVTACLAGVGLGAGAGAGVRGGE